MLHGGWRVPFLLGAVIAIVGLIIRRGLSESLPPQARAVAGLSPVVLAFRDHWQTILRMMSILTVNTAGFYLLFVYAASYLTERMHMSTGRALDINTINLFVVLAAILPAAALSDRIGRKPLLYAATIGTILFGWPLWWLMHQQSFESVLLGQLGFAMIFSAGLAVFPATIVEMLPPEVRVSGTSIGYNLGVGLIGGTAPLVATYLVARTGNDFAPVYYLMTFAFIQLVSLLTLPETARKPLLK
jgi:MHS family proline/betaine transporter-like MFS transporter